MPLKNHDEKKKVWKKWEVKVLETKGGGFWDDQKVGDVTGPELYKTIIIQHEQGLPQSQALLSQTHDRYETWQHIITDIGVPLPFRL